MTCLGFLIAPNVLLALPADFLSNPSIPLIAFDATSVSDGNIGKWSQLVGLSNPTLEETGNLLSTYPLPPPASPLKHCRARIRHVGMFYTQLTAAQDNRPGCSSCVCVH